MSIKQIKNLVRMGILCALVLISGIIYSLLYNEGRWVYPMDVSEYVFTPKDLPMLIAGIMIAVVAIYVVVVLIQAKMNGSKIKQDYTRTIPSFLGIFGLFGFAGFLGFWTYSTQHVIYPFIFFTFFSFFAFYYEGKLSHTLKDELFIENRRKAEIKAYRIGFSLLFIVIWLVGMGMFNYNVEWCAIFMLISVSLIYAFVLFYSSYLVYHYEKEGK